MNGVQKRADSTIHKRVADIIAMPSKAITPNNKQPIQPVHLNQAAMGQTFNTDSIQPHLQRINN